MGNWSLLIVNQLGAFFVRVSGNSPLLSGKLLMELFFSFLIICFTIEQAFSCLLYVYRNNIFIFLYFHTVYMRIKIYVCYT